MKKIKKILGYLLIPLTLIGLAIKFLMKSNVKGAREDIESAQDFEKKKKGEINKLQKGVDDAKIKEAQMKAKLEIIEESSDADWYKKE